MSDGRKRLSGSEYAKIRRKKEEKEAAAIKKTIKIESFFKVKPVESISTNKTSEKNVDQPTTSKQTTHNVLPDFNEGSSDDNEFCYERNREESAENGKVISIAVVDTISTAYDGTIRSSNDNGVEEVQDLKNFDENIKEFTLDSDPVKWAINEESRGYVTKFGFNTNQTMDFAKSKRIYSDGPRYLQPTAWQRVLSNGETVHRNYLVYSESTGCLFCGVCLLFSNKTSSRFVQGGYNDWKNVSSCLKDHENSSTHRKSVFIFKERSKVTNRIDNILVDQLEEEINYWKNVLQRVVVAVKALTSRGLPLRGAVEKFGNLHNGNYMMLLEVISQFDTFLSDHIKKYGHPGSGNTSYVSPIIAEEFLRVLADTVTCKIVEEIKKAKYFSIIVDSTPDISNVDQLSVVVRYVQLDGTPVERFLTFLPNTGHKALELFEAVNEVLNGKGIDLADCRGQSYDNASNMSGCYTGLQARIKEQNSLAEYIPCSAHSLNLVGTNAADCCLESCAFFLLLQELYTFFHNSTWRWEVLQKSKPTDQEVQSQKDSSKVKGLSTTRWSARDDACQGLLRHWEQILSALKTIGEDLSQKPLTRAEANGLFNKINTLETAILVQFWGFILHRLNATNKKLQAVETDLKTVVSLYGSLVDLITTTRNQFELFERKAKELSKINSYQAESKRIKKRKRKDEEIYEDSDSEVVLSAQKNFEVNVFNVLIDRLIAELHKRKNAYDKVCDNFKCLTDIYDMDICELREAGDRFYHLYSSDVEDSFSDELVHFKFYIEGVSVKARLEKEEKPPTKKRTKTDIELEIEAMCPIENPNKITPLRLLKEIREEDLQSVFPNVEIALRIFASTPISNCSAERSFSCLKRIKNYLRNRSSEERLCSVAVLNIEAELLNSLDLTSVIESFARLKSRRKV